jgi:hypothetical protein
MICIERHLSLSFLLRWTRSCWRRLCFSFGLSDTNARIQFDHLLLFAIKEKEMVSGYCGLALAELLAEGFKLLRNLVGIDIVGCDDFEPKSDET